MDDNITRMRSKRMNGFNARGKMPKTCRKMSLRATLVHAKTRIGTHADDRTIRGERGFLKSIEKHKNRRLERLCICPVTKWLLFKERIMRLNISLVRVKRFFWIICCPPLCYIMPQVAFWPPPNEYFFYIDDGPPRIKKDVEGHKEAVEIAERKKKFFKVFHANKLIVAQMNNPGSRMIPERLICNVRIPVLVIHGEDDRTVPLVHGKAICERAVNRTDALADAGHVFRRA
ncbi:hypothetical protein NECAME_08535 [Necator americanus]|uniref:Uncharacterized protein n=1 Tax=Necator americanus TaxID=51031 RepID=W2THS7_NECAM|nr:hypothetical protein NECAME_08535 [Necator americanus]ETN81358.1 hypothetical protein NECAME_08535 [Necator americanus]